MSLKTLDKIKKEKLVSQIFKNVSGKYDIMNDIMSLGLHRLWKEEFVKIIKPKSTDKVLDLAAGSGDITKILKKQSDCHCILFDASLEMIKQAKKKLRNHDLTFICGKCEKLPFKNNFFDYIIVSFGLRNFSDLKNSLVQIRRVLKKGGAFLCLEFSEINNPFFRKLFFFYCKLIPIYGELISGNKGAYQYLIQSIKHFPNQISLTKRLVDLGFNNIEVIDILDGLASIHIAKK